MHIYSQRNVKIQWKVWYNEFILFVLDEAAWDDDAMKTGKEKEKQMWMCSQTKITNYIKFH